MFLGDYITIQGLKSQIISQASKLFLKFGIRSVTMEDISNRLGISKKTLYQCFETKDDLIKEVVLTHFDKENEKFSSIKFETTNAIDEMILIFEHILTLLDDLSPSAIHDLKKYHQDLWKYYEVDHKQVIEQNIRKNLETGKIQGLYRESIDVNVIAKVYSNLALFVTDHNFLSQFDLSTTDIYKQIIQYHIFGIASEKGNHYLLTKGLNSRAFK